MYEPKLRLTLRLKLDVRKSEICNESSRDQRASLEYMADYSSDAL